MLIELIIATLDQKSIVANLLELYAYDFTQYCNFDLGDDGFYGYEHLDLYWIDPKRIPYLIKVDGKWAGLVLIQQGSHLNTDSTPWDIAEFFIMSRYRRQGLGTDVAHQLWNKYQGHWQVRVLEGNPRACLFWHKTIQSFTKINQPLQHTQIKAITGGSINSDQELYHYEYK